MRNIITAFILTICAATTLPAQFVQGTLQGGPPAPGTKSRSPLNSLERAASNRYGATIMTDSFGNQRFTFYVSIWDTCLTYNPETDPVVGGPISVFVRKCETDSIWYIDYNNDVFFLGVTSGGGGPVENWYTVDDTTTDATRSAYILSQAYWFGLDPDGEIGFQIGDVAIKSLYLEPSKISLQYADLGGLERLYLNTTGIDLITSASASRAVDITTDTMNWASSFDPTFLTINYLANNTYMFSDSTKAVALGQWPNGIGLSYDGTEKGLLYNPRSDGIYLINGDGVTGTYSFSRTNQGSTDIKSTFVDGTFNYTENGTSFGSSQISSSIIESNSGSNFDETASVDLDNVKWSVQVNDQTSFSDTLSYFQAYQNAEGSRDIKYAAFGEIRQSGGTAINASSYLGRAPTNATEQRARTQRMAWGVQQYEPGGTYLFDWIKLDLYDTITTKDAIQFYNDRYRWQNAEPSPTVGDTSFHFWAGIGSGNTNPGFMTLDQVCAHCAADAVNWYNSNGTTTDNTRIADVLETATWRSDDTQQDGVVPFRFELSGAAQNEPEIMVWLFDSGDSLLLYQSDQEITHFSNTSYAVWTQNYFAVRSDSAYFTSNNGGVQLQINDDIIQETVSTINQTKNNTTNGVGRHRDVIETRSITGTAQAELFINGTSQVLTLPSNTNSTFEIHISAVCSAAGNGVGISTGDAWSSWHVGGIKNIGGTTALVGTVQTTATAQADAGMSTSVVTIDADNADDSLRIQFTPPSTAGTTTVIKVIATIEISETSY